MRVLAKTDDYIVFEDTNTVNAWMIYIITLFTMIFVAWFFLVFWAETDISMTSDRMISLTIVEITLLAIGFATGRRASKTIMTTIDRTYGTITVEAFRGNQQVWLRTFYNDEVIKLAVTTDRQSNTQSFNPNKASNSRVDYTPAPTQRLQTYSNTYGVTLTLGSGHEIELTTRHRPYGWESSQEAVNLARHYIQQPGTGYKKRKG
ncbi:MAG: hypothetical protein AAF653_13490 [Chloroflexota bacterium]